MTAAAAELDRHDGAFVQWHVASGQRLEICDRAKSTSIGLDTIVSGLPAAARLLTGRVPKRRILSTGAIPNP